MFCFVAAAMLVSAAALAVAFSVQLQSSNKMTTSTGEAATKTVNVLGANGTNGSGQSWWTPPTCPTCLRPTIE